RYTNIWFQPTRPGTYHLFCAEYCGTRHSGMIGQVIVMEPADYQVWLSGGVAEGSLAADAEKLVTDAAGNPGHRTDWAGRGGSGLQHQSPSGRAGAWPDARQPVRQNGHASIRRVAGRRRSVHPRVDSDAGRQDHGRLSADHAGVSGPGERGGPAAADRILEVA